MVHCLFASLACDFGLADALNFAIHVVDNNLHGAVQTRTRDRHQLAAFSMASVMADRADRWHDLDPVASDIIVSARLNCACIVHGVAGTSEECGHSSSRVTNVGLDRACDVIHVIGRECFVGIVDSTQVHTSSINAQINWKLVCMLVVGCFLWVDAD